MTVAELIERLKEFDQSLFVVVIKPWREGEIDIVEEFEEDEMYLSNLTMSRTGGTHISERVKVLYLG